MPVGERSDRWPVRSVNALQQVMGVTPWSSELRVQVIREDHAPSGLSSGHFQEGVTRRLSVQAGTAQRGPFSRMEVSGASSDLRSRVQ